MIKPTWRKMIYYLLTSNNLEEAPFGCCELIQGSGLRLELHYSRPYSDTYKWHTPHHATLSLPHLPTASAKGNLNCPIHVPRPDQTPNTELQGLKTRAAILLDFQIKWIWEAPPSSQLSTPPSSMNINTNASFL